MLDVVDVVIVGAGQAGLSLSYELTHAGIEHVLVDRGRVAETWRTRWDSFCLVTPNWTVQLPGGHYDGDDPDGFMQRDEIVGHFDRYAASFGAPVQEGVEVTRLEGRDGGGFVLHTADSDLLARRVVLASGGYQRPHRPAMAAGLPGSVHVLDADGYTNPGALPPGAVLVVGSGQTGCQLAEELFEAGRGVFLACGKAPWVPRRLDGRDILGWLLDTPFFEAGLADLPSPMARLAANPQASGRDGGHDLNYRTLAAMGVHLVGRLDGVEDDSVHFADDLAESVAFGDARYADIRGLLARACAARGVPAPDMPDPEPFVADAATSLPLAGVGSVVFTSGFRPDYPRWVAFPDAFDTQGFPVQVDGSSTVVDGLHFMGVHFQRKRKSATLYGVAEDAAVLAEHLASA